MKILSLPNYDVEEDAREWLSRIAQSDIIVLKREDE